ncbi:hypothetical protein ACP70R_018039 [Stipagrostis hirtigluma subsp. patula]
MTREREQTTVEDFDSIETSFLLGSSDINKALMATIISNMLLFEDKKSPIGEDGAVEPFWKSLDMEILNPGL